MAEKLTPEKIEEINYLITRVEQTFNTKEK